MLAAIGIARNSPIFSPVATLNGAPVSAAFPAHAKRNMRFIHFPTFFVVIIVIIITTAIGSIIIVQGWTFFRSLSVAGRPTAVLFFVLQL